MTAATAPATARQTVVGGGTITALARTEIGYVLRNPVLWLGLAVSVVGSWFVSTDGTFTEGRSITDGYATWDLAAGPLALAAFLVGNWAALRERPSTTAEMFSSTPAARWERTLGLLAAAAVPGLMAAGLMIGQWIAVVAQGGVVFGQAERSTTFTPTPLELLGAPLAVVCAFVAGVAMARIVRSRAICAVLGLIGWAFLYVFFWIWLTAPFGVFAVSRAPLVGADLGSDPSAAELARWDGVDVPSAFTESYVGASRDLVFHGLHLGYVAGVILLLAGVALARSGPDRRTRTVLVTGLVLVVLAVAGQFLVHEGTRDWMGPM